MRQYSLPLHYEDAIKKLLTQFLNIGIAEHSDPPYSFAIRPVKEKKNLWLCVEFRKLNPVTLVQEELMPDTREMFPKLAKVRYFTKIDLTRRYWQIKIDPASKKYAAFSSPLGNMHCNVLAFGLAYAPSTFIKLMRQLSLGRSDVVPFLHDTLVFHTNIDE